MRLLILVILLFMAVANGFAQISVSGIVTNTSGEPLIGASVFFIGEDKATITDEQGRFELSDIEEGEYEMKVTYVGYKGYSELLLIDQSGTLDIVLPGTIFQIDEIEITSNYLKEDAPYSYSEMDKERLDLKDLGQDIPILLEHTPSMVVTSDAGAGIGYTNMRIRGSDATRINVTVNGVPLNDSESHGVFWVNMPDFSSSVESLQIQRGVGPSTMGAGAFGATVGLNTNKINQNSFIKFDGTYGSFNTRKYSIGVGTGLMNDTYTIEGRYSTIKSDGYVDRASSDLTSWYITAARIGQKHSLRFNAFSGEERTYQSWYGVPEALLETDRTFNFYTYDNQVDNYVQSHYQLIYQVQPIERLKLNTTLHYTKGGGFFESLKEDEDLADYRLGGVLKDTMDNIVVNSDLVRRKWLRNNFFGGIVDMKYDLSSKLNLHLGGGFNRYDGEHVGNVIFVEGVSVLNTLFPYYSSNSIKDDGNIYLKADAKVTPKIELFGDLQLRTIRYTADGSDDGDPVGVNSVNIDASYNFFNPKFGINYRLNENNSIYASYARANREPVRSDFIDAVGTAIPKAEGLNDIELGLRRKGAKLALNANLYYMRYQDQLVVTGAVNDVGAAVRVNVDESYRLGLELDASYMFSDKLFWTPNVTISRNKIKEFNETIVNFDTGGVEEIVHTDTDIAFSPNVIVGSRLNYQFNKNFSVDLLSKFVGQQFLDNTSNENKAIDPYAINDLVLTYNLSSEFIQNIDFKLSINNILNTTYESNGYTFSYIAGGLIEENFFYPQAGINFLLGASVTF